MSIVNRQPHGNFYTFVDSYEDVNLFIVSDELADAIDSGLEPEEGIPLASFPGWEDHYTVEYDGNWND